MNGNTPGPVHVAVNVMRARLTVLGFNLAIVTFQMNKLRDLPGSGAVTLPGVERGIHLSADFALFLAFGLAVVAMVAFIVSCALDPVGLCDHWSLAAGDLLMYQSLAQTVAGFFAPFIGVVDLVAAASPDPGLDAFRATLAVMGGSAWLLGCYVGPLVTLLRSPFGRRATLGLGAFYLALLLAIAVAGARVAATGKAGDGSAFTAVLTELVQPLRW